MKRLRHPIRAIREPFGTAGLIVAMVALVAALGGTALAASKLNSTQKKEVETIAKKFAGKPGAAGPQGAAGANGKDGGNGAPGERGSQGVQGQPGTTGTNGTNGTNGTDGENPVGASFEASEEENIFGPGEHPCHEAGGVLYEVAGEENTVCNGEKGEPGLEGNIKETLPEGVIETGTWAFSQPAGGGPGEGRIIVPISFTARLPNRLEGELISGEPVGGEWSVVHYETDSNFSSFCEGTASFPEPKNSLELCIYLGGGGLSALANTVFENTLNIGPLVSASPTERPMSPGGGVLVFAAPPSGKVAEGIGSWAIKG